MTAQVEVGGSVRVPAVRRPVPASRVIDLEVRPHVPDPRLRARAREAAARYDAHGTTLLDDGPAGSAAPSASDDAPDGWMLVGRWLTCVAVLTVLAVALASYGTLAGR